jgi:hypothetical protein
VSRSLLADLDAFFTDHSRCSDLDAGIDGPIVRMAYDCGPAWPGEWRRTTMPAESRRCT